MVFPNTDNVIYKRNTLVNVICQLRFPSILKVVSEVPAQFQERIRIAYPLFSERVETIQIPSDLSGILPAELKEALGAGRKNYSFSSDRESWIITLTRESVALTSSKYRRWKLFKGHFEQPLAAFIELYRPAFFNRIGLRYQNVIQRSDFGLEDVPWSELLQPYILGPLSANNIESSITSSFQTVEMELEGKLGKVRIQHGIVNSEDGEQCYLIDSDFYAEQRTEVGDAWSVLDGFNLRGTKLFRWCVTDKLHEALGIANS